MIFRKPTVSLHSKTNIMIHLSKETAEAVSRVIAALTPKISIIRSGGKYLDMILVF